LSAVFYSRNTRQILEWQNTWEAASWLTLVAGANAEISRYASAGASLQDKLHGGYVSALLRPTSALSFDAGVRVDDYDLAGQANTGRAGAAYRFESVGTKIHATYGSGFKAPSVTNRFGSPPYYGANSDIRPEKSTGWDAGVDQDFADGQFTVSATYFENSFRDLINNVYSSTTGLYYATNVKRAQTEGVEVALTARPSKTITLRGAYTYLSALDTSGVPATRLPRRPRHTADLDLQWQATSPWMVGAGLHSVSDRVQSATSRQENYATVRLYTSYALTSTVTARFRVENALNENYAEVPGYPALPRGFFSSVEWCF
jgi:vitamin B12 transporter